MPHCWKSHATAHFNMIACVKECFILIWTCWVIFHALLSADFFQNQLSFFFFEKFSQKYYQSVKWFGSRSGLKLCWSRSGSKLFVKVISRQQKLHPARKIQKVHNSLPAIFLLSTDNLSKLFDPDQADQNVGSDYDTNWFTLLRYS